MLRPVARRSIMLSKILVLIVSAHVAFASQREMLVTTADPVGSKTVPFDVRLLPGMNDPPETDTWLVRRAIGLEPEQVSVVYYGKGRVLISWVIGYPELGPKPTSMDGTGLVPVVLIGTASKVYGAPVAAKPVTYKQDYSSLAQPSYASPLIFHAIVPVTPGAKHYYSVGDSYYKIYSKEYSFTALPAPTLANLPFRMGMMSDIGQTYNTTQMLQNMKKSNPQVVLNFGDFTYSDTYSPAGFNKYITPYTGLPGPFTYQGRWDTWGRMLEYIAAYTPQLHTNGNHEIEAQKVGAKTLTQVSYSARFPVPRAGGTTYTTASNDGTTTNNMYYDTYVPGAHLVFLTPYLRGDTYGPETAQHKWLVGKLTGVDRTVYPWLIVAFHAPWYNTYASHFKENECMRQKYEPLFRKFNVDIVFTGHVHAYERSKPVYNYKVDQGCGTVHITVGDGGNQEKINKDFIDVKPSSWCADGSKGPSLSSPRCTYNEPDGSYCYKTQPAWSAYREPSFGHGILTIQSATTAKWQWYRAHEKGVKVSDSVTLTRNPAKYNSATCTVVG